MGKSRKAAASKTQYWLLKSEPETYSIDDLANEARQTTFWDGVRNYQARNLLRDTLQVGDKAFFYHSRQEPMAIVGTVEIVKAGYPDHTAFDPQSSHYDPKSKEESPTWFQVDVKLIQKFPQPLTREQLRALPALSDMMLLKRGSRLSIQPVTAVEWKAIHKLAGVKGA